MLVDEYYFVGVDCFVQGVVDLEWYVLGEYVGFGELFVEVIVEVGVGYQVDMQWMFFGVYGQCLGYGFGFVGVGEIVYVDGYVVLDQVGGFGCIYYFVEQGGQVYVIMVYGMNFR